MDGEYNIHQNPERTIYVKYTEWLDSLRGGGTVEEEEDEAETG